MNVTKSVTLVLTEEQINAVNTLLATRSNKTFEQLVHQCFEHGVKNLAYRTERNRTQYTAFKEWKQQRNNVSQESENE